ncbi:MAG: CbiX/SirB N-terminal domain-containing protein [Anaerolineae bacterium]
MKKALVLAGHGSHLSPQTAGLVWQQVDKLRALGAADEVTAAFWKEMPSFARVMDTLEANDVTIVPLFTAQGYFTRSVIPAEMGLTGALTVRDGRTLRYARTLGEHPFLGEVVRRRVEDMLTFVDSSPNHVGVALIGHGTKRNPTSRAATEAQAQRLRDLQRVGEVTAVYLDDTPAIPDAYTLLKTPIIIAVPNFLALGSHTTIDVPEALGLKAGETTGVVRGRTVYYTEPMGTDEALTNAIIELAAEAGAELLPQAHGSAWDGFPTAGRDVLLREVRERGEVRFGQLILTPGEVRTEGEVVTTFDAGYAARTCTYNSGVSSAGGFKGYGDGLACVGGPSGAASRGGRNSVSGGGCGVGGAAAGHAERAVTGASRKAAAGHVPCAGRL